MLDDLATLCPNCEGEGQTIGALGNRLHYRCRHCGLTFSEVLDDNNTLHPGEPTDDLEDA